MTTARTRQPASMRTLHQALAAPSRPGDEHDGFGEWEGGDMSWAWRQQGRPAVLPAPTPKPAEHDVIVAQTGSKERQPSRVAVADQGTVSDWPAIRSSIAATAPPPRAEAPLRGAAPSARSAIRPASARSAIDPAPLAPRLFEESEPAREAPAAKTVPDDFVWRVATATPQAPRAPANRRAKMLGISAVAVLVASGVAYSALQSISGPASPTMIAAASAPFGSSVAPTAAAVPTQAPAALPAIDTTPTASIAVEAAAARSTERLPEPGTAPSLPPIQSVATTAVLPAAAAPRIPAAEQTLPILPTGENDPVGDAILIAEKDQPGLGPVGAAPSPTTQSAPTVVAALPPPRETPAAAPTPSTARTSTPTVAAVAPAPAGPRVQATARDHVNMRSGPSNGSSVLRVVPAGEAVAVIRCNYWCQVEVGGQTGWVYQDFLDGPIDRRSRGRAVTE